MSISVIVMALISAFSAGSAVGFAVQDQIAKKQEERLSIKLDEVKARVDTLNRNLQPHIFFNSLGGLAAHDMATAALIADTVARTANYYAGSPLTASDTKEKHLTEAIEAIRRNQSEPLSEDGDKEDALYKQLCTTQVVSSTSREKMYRSQC